MNTLIALYVHIVSSARTLFSLANDRRSYANRVAAERGSLSLEQIIWTVAIAAAALICVGVVTTFIANKTSELQIN
ncbi:MAG: hypothetical protein JWQ43_135 [Glaciihabitans sp.]|nr:hypothetical protein [Glaciihabitans sp.]